ncbi:general transcription factor IIF subunit 1 [Hylaeus anthracinus]|uniref:general transcription factor IIF subunit 1 n=1 Tax=Hylaeus volcanicus TaxID=313075 RepID=UPI0023B7B843|nr:general transcription factor IIF subunit 1 [Hylaeus volcanicus]XP_053998194.1 general transcription factor IIF subunit 1 [Hylaeus anthracinus]
MTTTTIPKVSGAPSIQEFSIRVPKNNKKKHNVMRFNATLNVDFSKWSQVKMERENNMKEYKGLEEEMPKFGAGSEFGRDAREEARRKKFGITSRKYKPEDQPWILKSGGKTGKKFKGIREGGVSENAAYYVFTHAADGAIEAFPLHEWYNFQPIQRYKALSAEEAEQEFSRRNKVINYFSLMLRKRLRNDEEGGDDEEIVEGGKSKRPTKKEKDLKISEMDDWMDSDDDNSGSDADENKKNSDEEDNSKKKQKGDAQKKKKKQKASDDEAFEESDDGDEEGRECDYISDSSDSDSELEQQKEIKSVAEEDALRKLLASDEDEEDEEKADKKEGDEDKEEEDENKEKEEKDKDKTSKDPEKKRDRKKKKKQSKKKDLKKVALGKDSSSDFSSDSGSESDTVKEKDNKKSNSAHSSRSATPTPVVAGISDPMKRKHCGSPDISQAKKLKLDNFNLVPATSYIPGASESGITEDAVRRYLMRKPMTTTELLQKFKSKKTGLTSEQLVNVMTQILKKINPTKQTIKNKMYLSIKTQSN